MGEHIGMAVCSCRRRRVLWLQAGRCGHAGQRPKAVVPLATAPSALQDASNRWVDSRNVVCFNTSHQMPGFLRAYNRCWALATQAFVLLQGQWCWGPSICRGNGVPPSRGVYCLLPYNESH